MDRVLLASIGELQVVIVKKTAELANLKPKFVHDKTKDRWELLENVSFTPHRLTSPKNLSSSPS